MIVKAQLSYMLANDDAKIGVLAMTGQTIEERAAMWRKGTKAQMERAIALRESKGTWTGLPAAERIAQR
jgi:hypothetical protein